MRNTESMGVPDLSGTRFHDRDGVSLVYQSSRPRITSSAGLDERLQEILGVNLSLAESNKRP